MPAVATAAAMGHPQPPHPRPHPTLHPGRHPAQPPPQPGRHAAPPQPGRHAAPPQPKPGRTPTALKTPRPAKAPPRKPLTPTPPALKATPPPRKPPTRAAAAGSEASDSTNAPMARLLIIVDFLLRITHSPCWPSLHFGVTRLLRSKRRDPKPEIPDPRSQTRLVPTSRSGSNRTHHDGGPIRSPIVL
jgi:hypothetical protein